MARKVPKMGAAYAAWRKARGKCLGCGNDAQPDRVYCASCAEKVKDNHRKRRYGISKETFDSMLSEQGGKCAVCKQVMNQPYVDHDHVTNDLRGLLCFKCNSALGMAEDDPERLRQAAHYLERSKGFPTLTIMAVTWEDATFDSEGSDAKPELAVTVGILVGVAESHIKVAHEVFEDGTIRGTTAIPVGMLRGLYLVTRMPAPTKGEWLRSPSLPPTIGRKRVRAIGDIVR